MKIPIEKISIAPQKGRDVPKDVKLLALTMHEHGLLNPVTVVPNSQGGHTLYAGRRRLAAALCLGWDEIECTVLRGDVDVVAVTLVENNHRIAADIFDEAELFEKLMAKRENPMEVATVIGRPVQYVLNRLAIGKLPKTARVLWEKGWLTERHLTILGEMPTKDMVEAVLDEIDATEWQSAKPPDRLVKDIIERHGHKLSKANFDIKDEKLLLGVGSCLTCPKQTGIDKQVTMFTEMNVVGICLDPLCWKMKALESQTKQISKLEDKGEAVMGDVAQKKELANGGKRISFTSSYVDLAQKLEEFDYKIAQKNKKLARKQLKTILKTFLKTTMNIPLDDGRIILAARKLEVRQAMKDAKLVMAKEEVGSTQKATEKLQTKKRKAVRQTILELMAYIGDRKVGVIAHDQALWLVQHATFRSGFDVLSKVCIRRKWMDKGATQYDSKLHELVLKKGTEMSTDKRIALAMELMVAHYEPLQDGSMNKPMKFSEKAFGFKVQATYDEKMKGLSPKTKRSRR